MEVTRLNLISFSSFLCGHVQRKITYFCEQNKNLIKKYYMHFRFHSQCILGVRLKVKIIIKFWMNMHVLIIWKLLDADIGAGDCITFSYNRAITRSITKPMYYKTLNSSIIIPSILWRICPWRLHLPSPVQKPISNNDGMLFCHNNSSRDWRWDRHFFLLQPQQSRCSGYWRHLGLHLCWNFGLHGFGGPNCCWFSE